MSMALIYILGISRDTREHFNQIYDIETGCIKPECLHQGWQTSGSVKVVRLAFNLYTDTTPSLDDYERKDQQIEESMEYWLETFSVAAMPSIGWCLLCKVITYAKLMS